MPTTIDPSSRQVSRSTKTSFQTVGREHLRGLLTIDAESTIVFANPAIEEILGYSPDELIGHSKMTLIPPRLRDAHQAGLEKYLRTDEKHIDWDGIELPALHKDGHEVPVLISLREHRFDGERLFTGLFRDLTEQKYREHRFEAVFNNTHQFTGLLELDGTLIEVNETALSFADVDREEVVGEPIWETFWFQSSEDARETARRAVECARSGEFFREEVRIRGAERTAVIDFSVRPVTDHQNDIQLLIPEGATSPTSRCANNTSRSSTGSSVTTSGTISTSSVGSPKPSRSHSRTTGVGRTRPISSRQHRSSSLQRNCEETRRDDPG